MFIPPYVRSVLDRLASNGFDAYLVGGCVRDHLLGKEPGDFDIAVSSLPEETESCFPDLRIIETGIRHGTVTVVSQGHNLELTSFRSDGEYRDNRRPEQVRFTRDIHTDVARRDFTVNAIAYSPEKGTVDDFGGEKDLRDGILRAVGDPFLRFGEDALRIMRALRFASCLGFTIEPVTLRAIFEKKELLRSISAERIFTELKKLLDGMNAGQILAECKSVLLTVLPEAALLSDEQYGRNIKTIGLCQTTEQRFAALLYSLPPATVDGAIQRLKTDNRFRKTVLYLLENADRAFRSAGEVRRFAGETGKERLPGLLVFRKAVGVPEDASLEAVLTEKTAGCLAVKDLAVSGNDLLNAGFSGREVGEKLSELLFAVTEGECENERAALLKRANGGKIW